MFAGMDWSGTPDRKENFEGPDLYVACCVVVPNNEEANQFLDNLRKQRHKPFRYEFKGYHSEENELTELVEYVLDVGRAHALFVDKSEIESRSGREIFHHPDYLTIATGRYVLGKALEKSEISTVWCDEELSKEKQKRFNTTIQRDAKFLCRRSPKIRHDASHKSNMIQLADIVAYVLQRDALGKVRLDSLKRAVRELKDSGDVVWCRNQDDLRPYLQF